MLSIGEILQDRYQVVRQLGQGGMGAVYEAEDKKRFGRAIALKEILISAAENLDSKQQELLKQAFEREAKILAGLEHEAFPQVIDYFVEEERQFLVMELVQGEDLARLLEKSRKPFAAAEVIKWAEQLLDSLDELHSLEKPIFHRDIKPQNLKLTSRGRVKLLDFGIAKAADTGCGMTITNQTFVAATLHYSPLEQIVKAIDPNYRDFLQQKFGARIAAAIIGKTDERSDIYALGATLYHLLTDSLPVDSLKRSIELFSGNADPLPNPGEINKEISPALSAWILKAMEIERENRFDSAREMQTALQKATETDLAAEASGNTTFQSEPSQGELTFTDRTATSYLVGIDLEQYNRPGETKVEEALPQIQAAKDISALNNRVTNPIWIFSAVVIVLFTLSSTVLGVWLLGTNSNTIETDRSEVIEENVAPIPEAPVLPETDAAPENFEAQPDVNQAEVPASPEKNQQVVVMAPASGKKTKPAPTPAKTPAKPQKIKKPKPCQPVTVDCIINDY